MTNLKCRVGWKFWRFFLVEILSIDFEMIFWTNSTDYGFGDIFDEFLAVVFAKSEGPEAKKGRDVEVELNYQFYARLYF